MIRSAQKRTKDLQDAVRAALWSGDMDLTSDSIEAREQFVDWLRRFLIGFRKLGLAGSFAYSLPVHDALFRLYRIEVAELDELKAMQEAA